MEHSNNKYIEMFLIMIFAGLLSTMNVWADKFDDIRFSLNDVYMSLLMCGWMFLFMGIFDKKNNILIIGVGLVLFSIWCIRTQFLISEDEYRFGMIPHHSMAVHMSKKLLEKENNIQSFLQNLISTQENEISFLKKYK